MIHISLNRAAHDGLCKRPVKAFKGPSWKGLARPMTAHDGRPLLSVVFFIIEEFYSKKIKKSPQQQQQQQLHPL